MIDSVKPRVRIPFIRDETDLEVKMVFSMELGRSLKRTSVLFEGPSQKKQIMQLKFC